MITLEIEQGFKIKEILECGQCFRFNKLESNTYEIIALGERLRVTQDDTIIQLDCDERSYKDHWHAYFDMDRDYPLLMDQLMAKDDILKEAVVSKSGLRILQQEPFEMLMCFIISQNKSIPQIRILVERLSQSYGQVKKDQFGDYYCFPTPEELKDVTEEDFRELKVGFRAPYLLDAVAHVLDGRLDLRALYQLNKEEARIKLMAVKGIGGKVADCILLFAYGKVDVFPIDVWVRRIMTEAYFHGEKTSDRKILAFAESYFDGISGLAQQYLFYDGRDKAIK